MDLFSYLAKIKSGEICPIENTKNYLEKIKNENSEFNSFISIADDFAIDTAKNLKNKKSLGKLAGVPISIKDNIAVKGMRFTCGSKMLENYTATYNATIIDKILAEDAIIIGKANCDEFAMGATGEYSYFGATKNPLDKDYVAGGSSSGSAASVKLNQAMLSLGSETGGSVRLPAAYCGITGLKPTYGSVSRFGLVAFASSFDQIGVFANKSKEVKYLFDIIKGKDEKDTNSFFCDYEKKLSLKDKKDLLIGLPKQYFENLNLEMKNVIFSLIEQMKKDGYNFIEVDMPMTKYAVPTYYILAPAEASSNLSRFDGVRYGYRDEESSSIRDLLKETRAKGFGKEVKRRILMGTYVLSSGYYDAYYQKALNAKYAFSKEFSNVFEKCDLLFAPISDFFPPKLGENFNDVIKMYNTDIYSCAVNIAGVPSLSLPICQKGKWPVSMQIIGNKFEEASAGAKI